MSEELGRGVGSVWEVIKLKEGMNLAELRQQLNKLPNSGILHEMRQLSTSEEGTGFVIEIALCVAMGRKL